MAGAQYVLTGVLTADGPAYAWYHKSELAAGPPSPNAPPHSPGCSATSPYPVRTDWVSVANAAAIDPGSAKLDNSAPLLAKVHGWLELADSPADASTDDYYSLALIPSSGNAPLTAEQIARQGDQLKMALASTNRIINRQWVYVLDIDCHGQGTVLYPRNYAETSFPTMPTMAASLSCPARLCCALARPTGSTRSILLSTAQPSADPYVLNFEGVASAVRGESHRPWRGF